MAANSLGETNVSTTKNNMFLILYIIDGPSGTGKTLIAETLGVEFDDIKHAVEHIINNKTPAAYVHQGFLDHTILDSIPSTIVVQCITCNYCGPGRNYGVRS